jgi:hypothetical protein
MGLWVSLGTNIPLHGIVVLKSGKLNENSAYKMIIKQNRQYLSKTSKSNLIIAISNDIKDIALRNYLKWKQNCIWVVISTLLIEELIVIHVPYPWAQWLSFNFSPPPVEISRYMIIIHWKEQYRFNIMLNFNILY